jgi:hypothetical protein
MIRIEATLSTLYAGIAVSNCSLRGADVERLGNRQNAVPIAAGEPVFARFEAFAAKSWGLLLGSMEACGYTTAA